MSGSRVSLQHSWRKWPKYFLAEGVRVGSPPSERCVSNIQTETSDKEREEEGGGWKSTAVSGWQNLNLILHTVFKLKLVHFIHYWIHNELFSVVDLFFILTLDFACWLHIYVRNQLHWQQSRYVVNPDIYSFIPPFSLFRDIEERYFAMCRGLPQKAVNCTQ